MITSQRCKISNGDYLRIVFKSLLVSYWSYILLTFTILLLLTLWNITWIYVFLMVIFIFVPSILFYLYIWHGLKPEVRYSTLEKTIQISNNGLVLFYSEDKFEELSWSEFSKINITNQYLILTFKKSNNLFFLVPLNAFKTSLDAEKAISIIETKLKMSDNS